MKITVTSLLVFVLGVFFVLNNAEAKIRIKKQKQKYSYQVTSEELPDGSSDEFFDYQKKIIPTDEKDTSEIILESFNYKNKKNLAFVMVSEIALLFDLNEHLKKDGNGKNALLEKILKIYADKGKKEFKTIKQHLNAILKESFNQKYKASFNNETIQNVVNKFYADERIGEFFLGPEFTEITRAEIRLFSENTKKQAKKIPDLKELHKDISDSLSMGVHDMYLAVLLTKCLQIAGQIETGNYRSFLSNKMSKSNVQNLSTIKWKTNKSGRYILE